MEEEKKATSPTEDTISENTTSENVSASDSPKGKKINPLAILGYLGILLFIPWLMAKNDDFVMFHVKQGLVLFIGEVLTVVIFFIPFIGSVIAGILDIIWLIYSVIGIINALEGKKKELPYIGQYAHNWKI